MRRTVILPPVQPEVYPVVETCPSAGCEGRHVPHGPAVPTPLRDTPGPEVVPRYRGGRGGRTVRVYAPGVSPDQTSARLKGVAVMVSVPGMRYGAVATVLTALGRPLSVVAVSYAVQAADAAVAGLRREAARHGGGRGIALGADLTSGRGGGPWLPVGVSGDAGAGPR
jgi:hypothetical protein